MARPLEFFPALAEMLSSSIAQLGQPPNDIEESKRYVQGALETISKGTMPVLLIIDGLDEADGWVVGPTLLPLLDQCGNLRIVVSARSKADDEAGRSWLAKLGWNISTPVIELDKLSHEAVLEILQQGVNNPQEASALAEAADICNGDPLVTQFVVQLINKYGGAWRDAPKNASSNSLAEILRSWYNRALSDTCSEDRSVLRSLASLLAAAKAPLTTEEMGIALEIDLARIRGVLDNLLTLLRGDMRTGYVFSHPRMADTLSQIIESHHGDVAAAFERLFVSAITAAEHDKGYIPQYALNNMATHISESDNFEIMDRLLCGRWLIAHESHLHHLRAFLELVDAVRTSARKKNARSAKNGLLFIVAKLELKAVFWRVIAVERWRIQSLERDDIEQRYYKARSDLSNFQYSSAFSALSELIRMRPDLPPNLRHECERLIAHSKPQLRDALFSKQFDNDLGVELMRTIDPTFDLDAFAQKLPISLRKCQALIFLIRWSKSDVLATRLMELEAISPKCGSPWLNARVAALLAQHGHLSLKDCVERIVKYGTTGYEAGKHASSLIVDLFDEDPPNSDDAELLDWIFRHFDRNIDPQVDRGSLFGALLRHIKADNRPFWWRRIPKLRSSIDIEEIVNHGPKEWESLEVRAFADFLSATFLTPLNDHGNDASPSMDSVGAAHRNAFRIASIMLRLARTIPGVGRRAAIEAALTAYELIPTYERWSQPKDLLKDCALFVRYAPETTEELSNRFQALGERWAAAQNEYFVPSFSKAVARAAEVVAELLHKWGDAITVQLSHELRYMGADLAKGLSVFMGAPTAANRGELIRNFLVESGLPSRLNHSELAILGFSAQARQREYLESISVGAQLLWPENLTDFDTASDNLRWILGKRRARINLLGRSGLPPGYKAPPDVVSKLTGVFHQHDLESSGSWISLLALLPADTIRELLDRAISNNPQSASYVAFHLLERAQDPLLTNVIEPFCIEHLKLKTGNWYATIRIYEQWLRSSHGLTYMREWIDAYWIQLTKIEPIDAEPRVTLLGKAYRLLKLPAAHESLRAKVLSHLHEITDRVHMIIAKYEFDIPLSNDEIDVCRHCLLRWIVGDPTAKFYRLEPILKAVAHTDRDGQGQNVLDAVCDNTSSDNFSDVADALKELLTKTQAYAMLTQANESLAFTGRDWAFVEFFKTLDAGERDKCIADYYAYLDSRNEFEAVRRYLGRTAALVSDKLAYTLINVILKRPDVGLFQSILLELVARLSPLDAENVVRPILSASANEGSAGLVCALLSVLRPEARARLAILSGNELSISATSGVRFEYCATFPGEVSEATIDSVLALDPTEIRTIGWLHSAPAATDSQMDAGWAINLERACRTTFKPAIGELMEAIAFAHTAVGEAPMSAATVRDGLDFLGWVNDASR